MRQSTVIGTDRLRCIRALNQLIVTAHYNQQYHRPTLSPSTIMISVTIYSVTSSSLMAAMFLIVIITSPSSVSAGRDCGAMFNTDFSVLSSFAGQGTGGDWRYVINMCDNVNVPKCNGSQAARVCQYNAVNPWGPFVIADARIDGQWTLINSSAIVFSSRGAECDTRGPRDLTLTFLCSQQDQPNFIVTQPVTNNCAYNSVIRTTAACNMVYIPPTDDNGLSGGSIFLIIFFVGLFVYCAGGVALNYFYFSKNSPSMSSSPVELIPNVAFWKDLPFLMRDGGMFCVTQFRALCTKGGETSSYDKF